MQLTRAIAATAIQMMDDLDIEYDKVCRRAVQ